MKLIFTCESHQLELQHRGRNAVNTRDGAAWVPSTALSRDRLIRVAQATRNRKECPLQQHYAASLKKLLMFVFYVDLYAFENCSALQVC